MFWKPHLCACFRFPTKRYISFCFKKVVQIDIPPSKHNILCHWGDRYATASNSLWIIAKPLENTAKMQSLDFACEMMGFRMRNEYFACEMCCADPKYFAPEISPRNGISPPKFRVVLRSRHRSGAKISGAKCWISGAKCKFRMRIRVSGAAGPEISPPKFRPENFANEFSGGRDLSSPCGNQ